MMIKLCETCGQQIPKPKTRDRFCSRNCYGQWLTKTRTGTTYRKPKSTERTCEVCGKLFLVQQARAALGYGRFCSKTCKGIWSRTQPSKRKGRVEIKRHKRTTLKCEVCDKSFAVQVNEARGRRFCSKQCMVKWQAESDQFRGPNNPRWKGGVEPVYYGPNWRQQRRNARARDKYTCQRCGKHERELSKSLDVHHIIPFRVFGVERYKEANTLPNLVSLCGSCHLTVEHEQQTR